MKKLITLVLISIPQLLHANPNTHYSCSYSYYGAPMAALEFDQYDAFHLSPRAKISMSGAPPHEESLTLVAATEPQKIHAWISKESAENKIELIVYKNATASGDSEIINNQMPYLKEVWGQCKVSEPSF